LRLDGVEKDFHMIHELVEGDDELKRCLMRLPEEGEERDLFSATIKRWIHLFALSDAGKSFHNPSDSPNFILLPKLPVCLTDKNAQGRFIVKASRFVRESQVRRNEKKQGEGRPV
jgi:hypothetical protein